MTEQPQEQQQQQPVTQAGMRFFVNLDDLPTSPTYMKPLSLHRFEAGARGLITERFDKQERKWVDNPGLVAFTGIGGDESYKEIDEEEANRLIAMWTPDDSETEQADAEPVPENEGMQSGTVQAEDTGMATGTAQAGEDFQPVPPEQRQDPEYDFDYKPQSGEDHSAEVFGLLEGIIEVSEEPVPEEEPEPEEEPAPEEEERSFSVRGLLRRIFNA